MEQVPGTALEESGRIQQLLDEARELAPGPAWERIEELVQRLLSLQADAFSRLLAYARDCGADRRLDQRIAADELVSSLLLLHGLHPLPAEERISRALEELRPRLAAHGARAELVGIENGVARLRVNGSANGAMEAVRRTVEDAAPELTRVEVEEPPGPLVALRIAGASP